METLVSQVDVGAPIPSDDISRAYREKFSIDVSRFFPESSVNLDRVSPHGYYKFRPVISGDSKFYADLMNRIGYDDGYKPEFVAAGAHVGSNDRVLDIGCGPGRFSGFCQGSYKGIELNPDAVSEAQRHGRNVALERLEDQPLEAYDVVTMFQVLEHVSDPEAFLTEAVKRVAPGGKLIVSTPDMAGYMASSPNHVLNYPPHHLSWWTGESIAALMASNGISVETTWNEKLQPLHVTDWIESKLSPRRARHFDFSMKAKAARAAAKLTSFVLSPIVRNMSRVTGQCVMVVGSRSA
ncbi:class I SAM-dependent methyltransferase [Sphingomonas sp. DT-207]|uniref:class I SAM-dependent methyltransferase n=1 Tax=Sphingomonas sp. DT-207 TaxID=3396167 RepID=UPI003F1DD12E